jgi:preprotein translocase subunit SecA
VKVGMASYMADRAQAAQGGQRYDREGLFHWAKARFPGVADEPSEEDFRTQSRSRIQEMLLDVSRRFFPGVGQEEIDARLAEAFEGTKISEAEDAKELADWARKELSLEVAQEALTGVTQEAARQKLWNAFDERYRPEMRSMERNLILDRLDSSWKNHLYTMDHLRSTIGLRSYGQDDPKTEYKREGMKEFDAMWEGIQDKVTDSVFRMEEEGGFQEWSIGATIHETATSAISQEASIQAQQNQAIANSQRGEKKAEPIRNQRDKVGRNDPCPCGSGKKYKNCHMRQAV